MSYRQYLIDSSDALAWQQTLAEIPHGYWHTAGAARALCGADEQAMLYVYDDTGRGTRAVCPLLERQWHGSTDVVTPGMFSGFSCTGPADAVHAHWRAFAAARGYVCGYLALHPMFASIGVPAPLPVRNELFVIDLRAGAAGAHAGFDSNVRRSIARWQASGHPYTTARTSLRDFLLREYREFMATAGARGGAIWSQATLAALCDDPAVLLAGCDDERGLCAVAMFGTTPYGAEYLANVSVRDGRACTAALIWWGVQELAARRIPWLNLGGGVVAGDSLAEAKLRYRPMRLPFRVAREIYRPAEFERLNREADSLAGPDNGYFPPYRAPSSVTPGSHP